MHLLNRSHELIARNTRLLTCILKCSVSTICSVKPVLKFFPRMMKKSKDTNHQIDYTQTHAHLLYRVFMMMMMMLTITMMMTTTMTMTVIMGIMMTTMIIYYYDEEDGTDDDDGVDTLHQRSFRSSSTWYPWV